MIGLIVIGYIMVTLVAITEMFVLMEFVSQGKSNGGLLELCAVNRLLRFLCIVFAPLFILSQCILVALYVISYLLRAFLSFFTTDIRPEAKK